MKRLEVDIPRLALTPPEAAASIGVSPGHFDNHIASELRWVRSGRKRLVALSEIERWLDANSETPMKEQVNR